MPKKLTLEELKKFASEKGGECLSTVYVNSHSPMLWKCKRGHIWTTRANRIKAGTWCASCAQIDSKGSIEDLQKIAEDRGGELLTDVYLGVTTKYWWRCGQKHEWETSGVCVKLLGTWCPMCSTGLGERVCKEYLEQIFEVDFPKKKPEWLLSKNSQRLELDGYNEQLKIAFEHQGRQHYANREGEDIYPDTEETQTRDSLKVRLCEANDVKIIIIPEVFKLTKLAMLKEHIRSECMRLGIKIPCDFNEKVIVLKEAYNPDRLKFLQQLAQEKEGELLSTKYLGNRTPLLWKCKKGHRWETSPSHIVSSESWCPYCATELHPRTANLLKKV